MVILFNRIIKNILSNSIPHENIISENRDPPGISDSLKELIYEKNDVFQIYLYSNKNPNLFNKVQYLRNELKSFVKANKET